MREIDLESAFVEAFNRLLGDKAQYISRFEKLLPILTDTSTLENQLEDLEKQHIAILDDLRNYMEENTRHVQDQTEYNRRFAEMDAVCSAIEEQINDVKQQILTQQGQKEQIKRCLYELQQCDSLLEDFSLDLWNSMVESVTVAAEGTLTFRFRDGTEIPVIVPKKK